MPEEGGAWAPLSEGSTLPRAQSPFQPVGTGQGETLKTHCGPHATSHSIALGNITFAWMGKCQVKFQSEMGRENENTVRKVSRLSTSTTGKITWFTQSQAAATGKQKMKNR